MTGFERDGGLDDFAPTDPQTPLAPDGERRATVDTEVLEALVAEMRSFDETVADTVIDVYLADARVRVGQLLAQTKVDDRRAIANAAHGLRSSSALMGAGPLADLLSECERMGHTDTGDLAAIVDEIDAEFHEVALILEKLSPTPTAGLSGAQP